MSGFVTWPDGDLGDKTAQAYREASQAMDKWPTFNSAHEAFAVLKEEVDELWDQVKLNQSKRCPEKMNTEAIQVAAMALRFATEICNTEMIRK